MTGTCMQIYSKTIRLNMSPNITISLYKEIIIVEKNTLHLHFNLSVEWQYHLPPRVTGELQVRQIQADHRYLQVCGECFS